MKLTLTQTAAVAERIARETGAMHLSRIDQSEAARAHIDAGGDVVGQIGIVHWMPKPGKGTDLRLDDEIPGATFLTFRCAEKVQAHGLHGAPLMLLAKAADGIDVLRAEFGEIDRPALCFIPRYEEAELFSDRTGCMIVSDASDLPAMLKHLREGGSAVASPHGLSSGFRLPEGVQVLIHDSLTPNTALFAQLKGREHAAGQFQESRLFRAERRRFEAPDPFLDLDEAPTP